MEITNDIIYIGTDDTDIDLFEGQYAVPDGVSYNSYLIKDEKTAVMDTADKRRTGEWLKNLKNALAGGQPDYLIISHMEPDHSASLAALIAEYPEVTLVGNEKTFIIFDRFFPGVCAKRLVVSEGEKLSLGKHVLSFITAPMVHWPEVMFTYDNTDKVLFSADAFGKFGALSKGGEWTDEARRYYFNIVGKYGIPVQGALKKVAPLEINVICPLHGPVLKENLGYYIGKYSLWSSYKPEDGGVVIAYASIYGNTAEAAEFLAESLRKEGVETAVFDLARSELSEVISSAFRYDRLVIASVTYDAEIFPAAETFITELKAKKYQSRTVGIIENGSWSPVAGKLIGSAFGAFKDITLAGTVTVKSSVTDETREELKVLAKQLANK